MTTRSFGLPVNDDFRDFLLAFTACGVEYVVVGGYAVAVHGHQRATKDLDVLVRPTTENGQRVIAALARFGAPLHGATAADFAQVGTVFQLGVPPRRIDVVTGVEGITFDGAIADLVVVRLAGIDVPVVGRAALLRNKRAAGRPQDKLDVAELTKLARQEKPPRTRAKASSAKAPPRRRR